MLAWVSDRWGVLALALLSVGAFKETYLIASTIAVGLLIAREFCGKRRRGPLLIFGATMMITGAGAVFYFIVRPLLPELFESSFSPSSRIATLSQWMSLEMIGGKVSYVFLVLGPLLFLPVLSAAGRWLLLCVVPFWGASLLSNFPEMYKGINYYGVVPTYVSSFAAMVTVSKWRRMDVVRAPVVMVLLSALALSAGYRASPFGDVRELFVKRTFQPDSLDMIPQTMRVVASEFDSVFVLDKKQVVRQWLAERIPLSWDVLLVRTNTLEPPSANLLRGTKMCFADETWQVYCRKGVALQAR
jgi:MFS family permease